MQKIVVFGGAGMIGQVLVRQLLDLGYFVRVVDNGRTGSESVLPKHENLEFTLGDIRYEEDVDEGWDWMDAGVNLCGVVGFPACDANPKLAWDVHVRGAVNVAEYAEGRRLVVSQTGSQFGALQEICTEESPQNPLTVYGRSKKAGYEEIITCPNVVCGLYATAMGVSSVPRHDLLINFLCKTAVEKNHLQVFEPNAARTFINVRDFARSIVFFLEKPDLRYHTYCVGSDYLNLTKKEVVQIIQNKTGCTVEFNEEMGDPDKRDYKVSYSRLANEGFQCEVGIEETIDELLEYYRGKK